MKDVQNLNLRDMPEGAALAVKVVPGSSRDRVVGVLGEALKVATSAPPEKGRANVAVAAILAEALGVEASAVRLRSGPGSSRKEFIVAGLSAEEIRRRLAAR